MDAAVHPSKSPMIDVGMSLLDLPKGVQMVTGREECLRAVREQVANGADWIKVYSNGM